MSSNLTASANPLKMTPKMHFGPLVVHSGIKDGEKRSGKAQTTIAYQMHEGARKASRLASDATSSESLGSDVILLVIYTR